MTIDIVIPTKWRKDKLNTCLNSLFKAAVDDSVHVYIYFSEAIEHEQYFTMFKDISNVHVNLLAKEYKASEFWNDHLKIMTSDALCYINDDVVFFPETIEKIKQTFWRYFRDGDGVVGLNQLNLNEFKTVEGAFGAIGRKYAERFPDRKVFCEDYNRFYLDFEMMIYAKSINRFYFNTEAQIVHNHPCCNRQFEDATHKDVRRFLNKDKETFEKRKAQGLLYGKTWDLINCKEPNV